MTTEEAIAFGKEKVRLWHHIIKMPEQEPPIKALEILGKTEANYFGYDTLDFFQNWEKAECGGPQYYKYAYGKLVKCNCQQALASSVYCKYGIIIFSRFVENNKDSKLVKTNGETIFMCLVNRKEVE